MALHHEDWNPNIEVATGTCADWSGHVEVGTRKLKRTEKYVKANKDHTLHYLGLRLYLLPGKQ